MAADELTDTAEVIDSILTDDEVEDLTEADPVVAPVAYSGQDFDVEGLVRRLRNGDIKIPQFGHEDTEIQSAGFQRSFVWSRPQMDRFIESLLLGYPIPGIFLVRQPDGLYLVLDGQQRLKTLQYFYDGVYQRQEFSLRNVADKFKELTYNTLARELRRTIDNAFIQATIVNTDGTQASLEAVYQIFERLNSGGTQLTPHEIRVALYAGKFIDLLETLNRDANWRLLYGKKSPRIRDQELVLRILALYMSSAEYQRPLKGFLNKFVANNRNATDPNLHVATALFLDACKHLSGGPGPGALRKASGQVNAAQAEAVVVGLMRRLAKGPIEDRARVGAAVEAAKSDSGFDAATGRATADEEQVATRLRVAMQKFSEI